MATPFPRNLIARELHARPPNARQGPSDTTAATLSAHPLARGAGEQVAAHLRGVAALRRELELPHERGDLHAGTAGPLGLLVPSQRAARQQREGANRRPPHRR